MAKGQKRTNRKEEEAEGKQKEGPADGFAVCFNRSVGEAQPKRPSKKNPMTSRPFECGASACCPLWVRSGRGAQYCVGPLSAMSGHDRVG